MQHVNQKKISRWITDNIYVTAAFLISFFFFILLKNASENECKTLEQEAKLRVKQTWIVLHQYRKLLQAINDFADIDTNYFKEELHNSKGDLVKTQKLLEEMKQYYEGLNMPHEHLNIGKSVRNNSSEIYKAINHLLRIVSTYQAGKDMNIPNSNIHVDSNENSRQFIEETCRFEREMFNIHFSHCSTCRRRKINLHVNSNGVCSRCSKEKKGHNKFGHENSALPI